jgi:branched-chain amino acid aminotransferase
MDHDLKILKTEKSKIQDVDFNNFSFGSVFTDHMFECDFIEGKWVNPIIKPYQTISVEPSASVFHYGQAIFEGMKAYKDKNNEVWLFRPDQNFERINRSAVRMAIQNFQRIYFLRHLQNSLTLIEIGLNKEKGDHFT